MPASVFGYGIRIDETLVGAERAHPLSDRPAGHALFAEDRVGARGKVGHAFEPELMNLLGRHLGRRREIQGIGVIFVALRQAPDPRVVRGPGTDALQFGRLTAHRRIDFAIDDRRAVARPVACDAFGFGLGFEIGGEAIGIGGGRHDLFIEAEGAVDDEIGREDAGRMVGLHPTRFIVELDREILAARQIGFRIGGIGDAVLVDEEIGDRAIGAAELGDRMRFGPAMQAISEIVVGLYIMLPRTAEGFVVDEVHPRQFRRVDLFKSLQTDAIKVVAALDPGGRPIGEARLGRGAGPLVEPQGGREFGVVFDEHIEQMFVECVQPAAFACRRIGKHRAGGPRSGGGSGECGQKSAAVEHGNLRKIWFGSGSSPSGQRRIVSS